MAASLGSWLALTALALVGFNTSPEASNNSDQLFGLSLLFSSMASIFFFIAIAIIWKYPITEDFHLEIRKSLEKQK